MRALDLPNDDATAAAHTFGALATRLHESLDRASQALAAHSGVLPDGTLADLDALRAEFARRRLRVAVYGEVKAGKSTLVNAIAGALLSPVGFEPLTSVPVRITYGPSTTWRLDDRRLDNVAELEHLMRDGLADSRAAAASEETVDFLAKAPFETPPNEGGSSGRTEKFYRFDTNTARAEEAPPEQARSAVSKDSQGPSRSPRSQLPNVSEVVVETDLDLLQLGGQVDLVDTPGVGSAVQFDAVTAAALRSLDAVVLVVRYPALFTQFTRRLVEGLQADIGKLFVVWNLDAACAELTPEERQRNAETLRVNVAGAQELFLVDARAGLRAMEDGDAAGSVASGLTALIAALTRFASSRSREVAALREAAKRAHQRLDVAERSLTERRAALDQALAAARARLRDVQGAANTQSAAAHTQCADCETAVIRIAQEATARATALAADFQRQLRSARRRWIRRGHSDALAAAIAAAASRYADAVDATHRGTATAIEAAVHRFGASAPSTVPARSEPTADPLAPDERIRRATRGRWQLLRRAVWHRWYLPGLATLQRTGIAANQAMQAAWLNAAIETAKGAVSAVLAARLEQIAQDTEKKMDEVKRETNFSSNQAEFERLDQDLPAAAAQRDTMARISTEARALL
jgi:hypothetical protein